jgi:hypothetical protein
MRVPYLQGSGSRPSRLEGKQGQSRNAPEPWGVWEGSHFPGKTYVCSPGGQ